MVTILTGAEASSFMLSTRQLGALSLSVTYLDFQGAPLLHVDDNNTWRYLLLTVTNNSSYAITVAAPSEPPSLTTANIAANMTEAFFFGSPTSLQLENATNDGTNVTEAWQLFFPASQENAYIQDFYLSAQQDVVLESGNQLQFTLAYMGAVPNDPTARTVQITTVFEGIEINGNSASGSIGPASLRIGDDIGDPLPFIADIVGPRSVLNDGSSRSLQFRLINTSNDRALFLAPPANEGTQTGIDIYLPASDEAGAIWALWTTDTATDAQPPTLGGDAAAGWSIAADSTVAGLFHLTPTYTTVQSFPPGGTLDIIFPVIETSLPPGVVQAQITFRRFVTYGTQTLGVSLEKTPLVYNSGLGSGMILNAGSLGANVGLAISGSSTAALTTIDQQGTGAALVLSGGNGMQIYTSDTASNALALFGKLPQASILSVTQQSAGPAAQFTGGSGVQISPESGSSALALTANTSGSVMTVTQQGAGPAITTVGSVGIGISSPLSALDVFGDITMRGTGWNAVLHVQDRNSPELQHDLIGTYFGWSEYVSPGYPTSGTSAFIAGYNAYNMPTTHKTACVVIGGPNSTAPGGADNTTGTLIVDLVNHVVYVNGNLIVSGVVQQGGIGYPPPPWSST
jgi:hypothetical protein